MTNNSELISRKFEDVFSVDDYEILTPSGWSSIKNVIKTVPYKVWMIQTNTGKTLSCADDHILIDENNEEVFVKDLQLSSKIKTIDGIESIDLIGEFPIEENMYDVEVDDNEHLLYTNGFVSHNTTTVASYLLYEATFRKNVKLAILANKGDTAREILDRVKKMFEELPWYLKPGVVEWNKGSIELSNGNVIMSAATSSSSIRGKTMNCVTGDTKITIQFDDGTIQTIPIETLYKIPNLPIIKYENLHDDSNFFNETVDIPIEIDHNPVINKYETIYNNIIAKAQSENRSKGTNIIYENHHIVPRSFGGTDDKSNLVLLTLREHFICHKLLVKFTSAEKKSKMLIALYMMSNTRGLKLSSRVYELSKIECGLNSKIRLAKYYSSPENRQKFGDIIRQYWKNNRREIMEKRKLDGQYERLSQRLAGVPKPYMQKTNRDPEKIRKTAEKHTGMKRTEETKLNMSNARRELFQKNPEHCSIGKGSKYIHNIKTNEIKRISSDEIFDYPWVMGTGKNHNKNTIYINNPETRQVKRVKPDFEFAAPWVLGYGSRKK